MNEWQPDLRHWTPSNSARYPLRMKIPKPATDPETCKLIIYISPNHVLLFLSGYGIHSNNESAEQTSPLPPQKKKIKKVKSSFNNCNNEDDD